MHHHPGNGLEDFIIRIPYKAYFPVKEILRFTLQLVAPPVIGYQTAVDAVFKRGQVSQSGPYGRPAVAG